MLPKETKQASFSKNYSQLFILTCLVSPSKTTKIFIFMLITHNWPSVKKLLWGQGEAFAEITYRLTRHAFMLLPHEMISDR